MTFSLEELSEEILKLGKGHQATGANPISYQRINRFTEPMKDVLLKFLNFCWERGVVQLAWKKALEFPIYKYRKPSHLPKSYRPIALTPHLGNLFETLTKNQIDYSLQKADALHKCHAGFAVEELHETSCSAGRTCQLGLCQG